MKTIQLTKRIRIKKNGDYNYQTITKLYNANKGVLFKLRNFVHSKLIFKNITICIHKKW
jgi:predicted phosphohydrolase